MPLASTILMIRPASFAYNEETASNNFFQNKTGQDSEQLSSIVLSEFDKMVLTLRENDINVLQIEDTKDPNKPDAIFPNNWISTSPSGLISVYPMFAMNRRAEKRDDILKYLSDQFIVNEVQDWSEYESEGKFLEGTGSMVIDHDHKMIYAGISERTSITLLEKYAVTNGYQAIVFVATDNNGLPVYHTNVMMTLGERFCLLCEESIEEEWELIAVRQLLESTNHEIIPISKDQMHCFAGNALELKNNKQENIIVMSQAAFSSLRKEQKDMLAAYGRLLAIDIPTIEQVEGGSVRCMMAEIFLEKKERT